MARFTCMNLNSSSISSGIATCALQLVDIVEIPSIFGENPVLIIPHTLQYCWLHRSELIPNSHKKVVQWNLSNSFPSATHLSSRLLAAVVPFRAAFDMTHSRNSSNLVSILGLLWIFRIRWIVGIFILSGQPLSKMILTMFLPVSPSKSSETACLIDWCCSRRFGFGKISPQRGQG